MTAKAALAAFALSAIVGVVTLRNGYAEAFSFGIYCFTGEYPAMYHDLPPFGRDHATLDSHHPLERQHIAEADIQVSYHDRISGCPGSQAEGLIHDRSYSAAMGMHWRAFGFWAEPYPGMEVFFGITEVTNPETVAVRFTGDEPQ